MKWHSESDLQKEDLIQQQQDNRELISSIWPRCKLFLNENILHAEST